ncbi:MAG: hypothetical protein JXQ75_14490 [Phycisphaerae bacterium]|nr:hypothetical protein [Phycisphaerae bacterium]
MNDVIQWLQDHRVLLGGAVAVLLVLYVLRRLSGGIRRLVRRRGPPKLHPKLQQYAGRNEADIEAEHLAAERIIATSSTGIIAGYEIVRQVEAVFVEGHRTQGEAIRALKATAASRGANAIINLAQQHTAAGRCTAQGDAVVLRPIGGKGPTDDRGT